jgi:L-threonylcarbamoyladenylate synthase
LHIKSFDELPQYVKNISHDAKLLAENFWAGPITMLFHKSDLVSNVITGGSDKIAIRVPANTIFQEVLTLGNFALVAPSANIHKKLSPTKAEHVIHQMNGLIDAILDGGQCKIGVESTIVDVTTNEVKILRAGPILQKDIEHILNKKIQDLSISSANNVSGSMKIHYKPNKPVFLTDVDGVASYKSLNAQCVFIGYSENFCNMIDSRLLVRMPCNATGYQAKLYDVLYELDAGSAEIIVVEMPPQTQDWLATNDKLNRMTEK